MVSYCSSWSTTHICIVYDVEEQVPIMNQDKQSEGDPKMMSLIK